jgi:hypothetical protein
VIRRDKQLDSTWWTLTESSVDNSQSGCRLIRTVSRSDTRSPRTLNQFRLPPSQSNSQLARIASSDPDSWAPLTRILRQSADILFIITLQSQALSNRYVACQPLSRDVQTDRDAQAALGGSRNSAQRIHHVTYVLQFLSDSIRTCFVMFAETEQSARHSVCVCSLTLGLWRHKSNGGQWTI